MVGLPRPARDQVKKAGFGAPVGIWGEVNYPGQLFRAAPNLFGWFGRHVVPYVLIRSEVGDALEACQVAGGRLQQRHDRLPHGMPATAELTADPVHGGVLAADLLNRPPTRTRGELAPGGRRPARPAPRTRPPDTMAPGKPTAACATRSSPAAPPTASRSGAPPPGRARRPRTLNSPSLPARTPPSSSTPRCRRGSRRPPGAVQADQKITTVAVGATRKRAAQRSIGHRRGP